MKNVGVLLSGCGVYDGTEIHESVITLLALDRNGVAAICMAPDMDQHHVVNHLTGQTSEEKRNVLVESARIARGEIMDVKRVRTADLDALIMPGGFGAAKNLSDFAIKGNEAEVHPEVRRIIAEMADAGKPIGAICISPAVLAKVLEDRHPQVTIGNDLGTAEAIEAMGGRHTVCDVTDIHVDFENKLVTTPAYMIGPDISKVAEGIEKLINKILEMI
ncbi:MAG: isoprenoid biosynthesis glyoxalase ElbB [Desulfosalsimonas sp.]|uniref:isoprenoid biosynthesis glyoxalase ElbB n=1 Tax=Desulfosalsimonas sp. TaxID=3073848 RepID=UPI003970E1AF